MKYCPVELECHFSCKQMFERTDERGDDLSVCDSRFRFGTRLKKLSKVPFQMFGIEAKLDNLLCEEQEVDMPEFPAKKLLILGFAEYSTFTEKLILRYADGKIKEIGFTFYGITENLESLYESELDSNTALAFRARGKFPQKMQYYIASIDLDGPLSSVVLPLNPELHVAAMTLSK